MAAVGALITTATQSSAKAVVTVADLKASNTARQAIRLGARLADEHIATKTHPDFLLRFIVTDIASSEGRLPVVYHGIMPDTLAVGRDVILEGDFDGKQFVAKSVLTQCPSKYEPPLPE